MQLLLVTDTLLPYIIQGEKSVKSAVAFTAAMHAELSKDRSHLAPVLSAAVKELQQSAAIVNGLISDDMLQWELLDCMSDFVNSRSLTTQKALILNVHVKTSTTCNPPQKVSKF